VKLVKLPKIPMVVGDKIFKMAEGIPSVEEVKVHLVGLQMVVECKRENQTGKLVSLAMVVVSK
ncbi:hypothetical protein A2U01_0091689, partial [Trifolium medium]|nr:hypothetical protein [Trifolium medium]